MAWQQTIIWTNDGLIYWCIYASLSLNELVNCVEAHIHLAHSFQVSYSDFTRLIGYQDSGTGNCHLKTGPIL